MTKKYPVKYFRSWEDAQGVSGLLQGFPNHRIVEYTRGFAIQYYPSGPYYPELGHIDWSSGKDVRWARGGTPPSVRIGTTVRYGINPRR